MRACISSYAITGHNKDFYMRVFTCYLSLGNILRSFMYHSNVTHVRTLTYARILI